MGFWVPSDSPFVNPEVGVAIAGQWREVGIDVQIENTAYSARRPTLVDRSIDIPWHFINSAEGGFFGNMYVDGDTVPAGTQVSNSHTTS